jgi:hypothetical protein
VSLQTGFYDENIVKKIAKEVIARGGEGIVIRTTMGFNYDNFNRCVAKYVRPNHVQTDDHWSQSEIMKNKLKE